MTASSASSASESPTDLPHPGIPGLDGSAATASPETLADLAASLSSASGGNVPFTVPGVGSARLPLPDIAPADRQTSSADEKPRKGAGRNAKLIADVAGLYGVVGGLVFLASPTDGTIIMSGAEDRARELVAVAEHHPQMMRVLRRMTADNAYIALAIGHGAMGAQMLAAHGINPVQAIVGVFTPKPRKAVPAPASTTPARDGMTDAQRAAMLQAFAADTSNGAAPADGLPPNPADVMQWVERR